ncbi:MAG: ABC transporter ATP-binding protein [Romboutsia sp.]
MGIAVKLSNISQNFKKQVVLNGVSINFEENKIYGLLGKNGVGKTTLLNIMTNQLLCDSGNIEILGVNPKTNSKILENICIVREREFIDEDFRVKDIFDIYSYFSENYDKELEKKLCNIFDINKKKFYRKLSRGIKSMITNIIGICSNSPITIFDEPTIGLDASNRQEFYNLILDSYMKNPRTIIISTHLIDEIESLLENVIIIDKGKVILDDSLENISQKSFYISGKKEDLYKLECLRDKSPYKVFGSNEIYYYYGNFSESDLNYIDILDIEIEKMSLQDLFINTTKKEVY